MTSIFIYIQLVSVLINDDFSRVLLMEEPRARLLVRPGALQRPQRVWQAAGDNADPDTGQLHGSYQLWVLVRRPAFQREEADPLRGVYADQGTVFQLTANLKWPYCTTRKTRVTDEADCVRYWRSGQSIQGWFRPSRTLHIRSTYSYFACLVGPEKQQHSVRKKPIYLQWHHVHVLMVTFIPLLQVVLQNNGVTFDLIFVDRHCEISMLFYQPPENLLPVFVGSGNRNWKCVFSFSSIFASDVERNCTGQRQTR